MNEQAMSKINPKMLKLDELKQQISHDHNPYCIYITVRKHVFIHEYRNIIRQTSCDEQKPNSY